MARGPVSPRRQKLLSLSAKALPVYTQVPNRQPGSEPGPSLEAEQGGRRAINRSPYLLGKYLSGGNSSGLQLDGLIMYEKHRKDA